jgi:hypothetical protein
MPAGGPFLLGAWRSPPLGFSLCAGVHPGQGCCASLRIPSGLMLLTGTPAAGSLLVGAEGGFKEKVGRGKALVVGEEALVLPAAGPRTEALLFVQT